jgi:hypothetical protein
MQVIAPHRMRELVIIAGVAFCGGFFVYAPIFGANALYLVLSA